MCVYIGCQKSLAVFPQACLCKRVVLVIFVASVHARAFWKALFTRVDPFVGIDKNQRRVLTCASKSAVKNYLNIQNGRTFRYK